MNSNLALAVRDPGCQNCRLYKYTDEDEVCVTGDGRDDSSIMVVTKFPAGGSVRVLVADALSKAGIDLKKVMWASAVKCKTYDMAPTKTDQKACKPYILKEIEYVQPTHILLLGNEALFAVAGHSGIMKYRSKTFELSGYSFPVTAFATISPSMLSRNPGLTNGFMADLKYFSRLIDGGATQHPDHVPGDGRRVYVGDKDTLRLCLEALKHADAVSYDIESTGGSEFDLDAAVVSISLTINPVNDPNLHLAKVWEIPLFHPESPWRNKWVQVLTILTKGMLNVPRRIGQNLKYDTRWIVYFTRVKEFTGTFDTIISASVLDENEPKGLKPRAVQNLGADPWAIETKDLLTTPLAEILEYNGLDTWHTIRLYYMDRERLKKDLRAARLFRHLLMPAIQELVPVEQAGVYIHLDILAENTRIAAENLVAVEEKLKVWLPEDLPENIKGVNYNPSNFLRWWLFDYLRLPVLARGKTKDDGGEGDPSCAEAIMMELAEMHEVPKLLLERTKWYKMGSSFFVPYAAQLDIHSRIHTTFKPWGTVTGRLSSGKEDAEKISGKKQTRGCNLQQVPRDILVRGVFGAPPGSAFIEADYSQVELRVAAFLANEPTMKHLYNTGQDIHMAMAMRMTGKPADQVTKEERKKAKAVNFGFLYGMGWKKFISTAWSNYGVRVTEEEARAFRETFFAQFTELRRWHSRQRSLAQKYKRVYSPLGRCRNLPDIDSKDEGVRAEAERQAINSPVQGFASDMALLSMVMLSREFRSQGLKTHAVGTVHDAVNFEGPNYELARVLPMIKKTMENLPLDKLFGVYLDIPIVADIGIGQTWGGKEDVPAKLLTRPELGLHNWLCERDRY